VTIKLVTSAKSSEKRVETLFTTYLTLFHNPANPFYGKTYNNIPHHIHTRQSYLCFNPKNIKIATMAQKIAVYSVIPMPTLVCSSYRLHNPYPRSCLELLFLLPDCKYIPPKWCGLYRWLTCIISIHSLK
jgi:hypothetical protein